MVCAFPLTVVLQTVSQFPLRSTSHTCLTSPNYWRGVRDLGGSHRSLLCVQTLGDALKDALTQSLDWAVTLPLQVLGF